MLSLHRRFPLVFETSFLTSPLLLFSLAIASGQTAHPGVECRSGGSQGSYTIDFTFNNNLTSVASVTTSCGTVTSSMIDATDPHRYMNLAAATCNAQNVTVTLIGVTDDLANTPPSASVTIGLLLGDVDGDRTLTSALTKADNGQTTDGTNFREDLNVNGRIDRNNAKLIKQQGGTSLP
jgi:hypothetical protein